MTVQELLNQLAAHHWTIAGVLIAVPLLTLLIGTIHSREAGGRSPYRYLYSLLIYSACVPGCFAVMLTLYSLLFLNTNLLRADVVLYFLPIITMIATLGFMSRKVVFEDIPGFGRLSGLMVLLGLSFAVLFFLSRTRVWLIFGGGFGALVAISVAAFAIFKWAGYMLFRGRGEPRVEMPSFD